MSWSISATGTKDEALKAIAGHSLRAGFITSAAKKGASLPKIMRQSRHKSERMAMTYIRPATLFDDNAASNMADDDSEDGRRPVDALIAEIERKVKE